MERDVHMLRSRPHLPARVVRVRLMLEDAMKRRTYTVTEAAEILGISRSSAYECVRRGEIPSLALGRRIVITPATLRALLGDDVAVDAPDDAA